TSSSLGAGPNSPEATLAPSSSRPFNMVCRSASESNPALCNTLACAFDASTSYGANTQSKCVDTDNAAMASDGPPEKRPPHSAPSLVLCGCIMANYPPRLLEIVVITGRLRWLGNHRHGHACYRFGWTGRAAEQSPS